MVDVRNIVRENVEYTLNITPSVIALARMAKIAPEVMAKALSDDKANALYRVGLVAEVTKLGFEKELAKDEGKK
jgi:hypothetical protein